MKKEDDEFLMPEPEEPVRKKPASRKRKRRKKKAKINGHAIFFLVIAIIFAIVVIQLLIWNKGKHSDYDPNDITDEFDVELLDYIQPLDSEALKGREDDGINTVLALGNDPLSDDRSDDGLAALMEKATGANIYNGAFPGSTIAMKNPEYDSSYPLDGLSLYWIAAALCNQNFELADAITKDLNDSSASAALDTLKSVDLSTVDSLVILYDMQDYMGRRIVYDKDNKKNLNTVYGALNATIKLFQEEYPYIRIYVVSPTYGSFTEGDGTTYSADLDDLGNGTLMDYINWMLEVVRSDGVTFIDTFYGAVSMEDTDCLTDGFHLNEKGRKRFAARFAEVFAPSAQ